MSTAKTEAHDMALSFLRDNGPHTMGPIETNEELAAAIVFVDLLGAGYVSKANFGDGFLQFAITDQGLRRLGSDPA